LQLIVDRGWNIGQPSASHRTLWTCPPFWHKKLRLKIQRMENLSHGVIAPEVHERV
jgi:hypothetical protein